MNMIRFKCYIRNAVPYRGGNERPAGGPMIKLSSNENMLGPSTRAMAAIRAHVSKLHEYRFEQDGLLREAIGTHLGLAPEQVVTGNSGMELLDLISRGFLEEGNEAILCSPTFMAYKSF